MAITKFIGLKELEGIDQDAVKDLTSEYEGKILKKVKGAREIVFHIKSYKKGGKAREYSVKLRVVAPGKTFETSAEEWDLPKITHMVYNEMINEIEHSQKNATEGKDLTRVRKGWKLFKFFGRQ